MTSIWLRDLASYGLQVALVVSAGVLLASVFRWRATTAALVYWQAMLGLCLVLPVCQTWKPLRVSGPRASAPATAPAQGASRLVSQAPPQGNASPSRWPIRRPVEQFVLLAIAAGIGVRGLWLAIGFHGLRRLRRRSLPAPADLAPLFDDAQRRIGVRAEFRISERASAPITFGLRRPVILLPPNVAGLDAETQRAVVYHELIHIRRRDWAWCVVEEFAGAILWFHPAVWWLIGRIHLMREQVVDRTVIELTASREGYVDALLVVAQAKMDARLIPAPLFLRKGLLKSRVSEILKEKTMSTRRLIIGLTLSAAALILAARAATSIFPLRVHAQELSSAPIQILQGGDNVVSRPPVVYPGLAVEKHVEGDVALEVTVDERGQVSDAHVLSGPVELRRACLRSVLEWRFHTPGPGTEQVVIHFQLPQDDTASELRLPGVPDEHVKKAFFFIQDTNSANSEKTQKLENALRDPQTSPEDKAKDELAIAKLKSELDTRSTQVQGNLDLALPEADVVVADPPELSREVEKLKAGLASPDTSPEDRAQMKKQLADRLQTLAEARDEGNFADVVRTEDRPTFVRDDNQLVAGRLAAIRSERLPEAALKALTPQLGVRIGDMLNEQVEAQVSETIRRELGEQFRVAFHPVGNGSVEMVILGPEEQ